LGNKRNARVFHNVSKQFSVMGLVNQILLDWDQWHVAGLGGRNQFVRVVHYIVFGVEGCMLTTIACNDVVNLLVTFFSIFYKNMVRDCVLSKKEDCEKSTWNAIRSKRGPNTQPRRLTTW
jgi:hypothetical protein